MHKRLTCALGRSALTIVLFKLSFMNEAVENDISFVNGDTTESEDALRHPSVA
jgi:hypothetical protein